MFSVPDLSNPCRDYLYLFRVIPVLLDPERLVIQPVLIHGDLWVRMPNLRNNPNSCIF